MITDFAETLETWKKPIVSLNEVLKDYRESLIKGVGMEGTIAFQIDRVVREVGEVSQMGR